MPDISMCTGTNCARKGTCFRFTAKPNPYRQTYFSEPPINPDGTCDYYDEDLRVTKVLKGKK